MRFMECGGQTTGSLAVSPGPDPPRDSGIHRPQQVSRAQSRPAPRETTSLRLRFTPETRPDSQQRSRGMRRLTASKAWAAAAVVAAIVAVLGVMVGVGIADPGESHGGSPTDVFMNTVEPSCTQADREGVHAMGTAVDFDQGSHLLVYFTSQWSGLNDDKELLLGFEILDVNGEVFRSPVWADGTAQSTQGSGTVMWTFEDVPAGDYTVQMFAQVRTGSVPAHAAGTHALLENCALTVFVIPAPA